MKCYDASSEECDCICGGNNHGVGRAKAITNLRAGMPTLSKMYTGQILFHPSIYSRREVRI